jgi:hypothetical protein
MTASRLLMTQSGRVDLPPSRPLSGGRAAAPRGSAPQFMTQSALENVQLAKRTANSAGLAALPYMALLILTGHVG